MPEISDAAYDKLCRRAEDLTGRFPIFNGIVKKLNGDKLLKKLDVFFIKLIFLYHTVSDSSFFSTYRIQNLNLSTDEKQIS